MTTKRQRLEEAKSSASAFFIVGGLFLAAGLVTAAGIIRLPLSRESGMIIKLLLWGLGIACLIAAGMTRHSLGRLSMEADAQDSRTRELTDWFVGAYTASCLDEKLLSEDPSLSGSELELKRFELIQDLLITHADLPDQDFVDMLCEKLYGTIYETPGSAF